MIKKTHSKTHLLEANDLEINCLYEIMDDRRKGAVVVRIKETIYEVNDFSDYWEVGSCPLKFRKFQNGESVTLTQSE